METHQKIERHTLLIPQVSADTRNWTARITITEELGALICRNGEKMCRYILTDDEGNEVAATVYGRDVLTVGQVLEHFKVFEITNARIQIVEPQYRILNQEIQWRLQQDTMIRPIPEANPNLRYFLDNLIPFAMINESIVDSGVTIDIMGIIIDAEDCKSLKNKNINFQRFIFINPEMIRMSVTIWDPVLSYHNGSLIEAVKNYSVVVAKRLRVTKFDGLSLSAKNSSSLIFNPPIEATANMKSWFTSLPESEIQELRNMRSNKSSTEHVTRGAMTIHTVHEFENAKESGDYWVKGVLQLFEGDQKLFYVGCSNCHSKINATEGVPYPCFICKKNVIATFRAIVSMNVGDQTGAIKVVAIGDVAEKILQITASQLASIINLGQNYDLESVKSEFQGKLFLMLLRHSYSQKLDSQRRPLLMSYYNEPYVRDGSQSSSSTQISTSDSQVAEYLETENSADYSLSPLKRQLSQITIKPDVKVKNQLLMILNESDSDHHHKEDNPNV